jgi:hypothetical protein
VELSEEFPISHFNSHYHSLELTFKTNCQQLQAAPSVVERRVSKQQVAKQWLRGFYWVEWK